MSTNLTMRLSKQLTVTTDEDDDGKLDLGNEILMSTFVLFD